MKTKNIVKEIEKIRDKEVLDLSFEEDLSIALMNLISLEEHSFFSYLKTKEERFLKILEATRELRKKFLALMVRKDDSETWCMSKHLLASSMRLYEMGNRMLHEKKEKEAKEFYADAGEIYGLFWTLNKNKEKIDINKENEKGIFSSIKKLLECCNE